MFTSGLSVNEVACAVTLGARPLTHVMGRDAWCGWGRRCCPRCRARRLYKSGPMSVVGVELRRGEHDLAKRTIASLVLDLNDR